MSHIRKLKTTYKVTKYFMDEYTDPIDWFKHFEFIISIHVLNNVKYLSQHDIESLLLRRKNLRIGLLIN